MDVTEVEQHLVPEFECAVQDYCQPLFKHLSINYFDYARFYPDGSCFILSSDPSWVKSFVLDPMYRAPQFAARSLGSSLWASYIPEHFLTLGQQEFNHLHGLTHISHHPRYHQVVNFSAPPSMREVLDVYLNQRLLLMQFTRYFEQQANGIIAEASQHRLQLPPALTAPPPEQSFDELYELFSVTGQYVIDTSNGCQMLSKREAQCVSLLFQGLSAKQIADKLFISRRTVETHLETLRQKTHCRTTLAMLCQIRNPAEVALWRFSR